MMKRSAGAFWSSDDLSVQNISIIPEVNRKVNSYEFAPQMNFVVSGVNMSGYVNNTSKGGAIQIENNGWLKPFFAVQNSSFRNCRCGQTGGSVYFKDADVMEITDSLFENCSAVFNGSVGGFENSRLFNARNVSVRDSSSNIGGSFYCNNISEISVFDGVYVNNSNSNQGGGAIYQSESVSRLYINNSHFNNCSSTNHKGGVIYSNSNISTTIDNVVITNSKSSQDGGSIFIESFGNTTISNTLVEGSVSQSGGGGFLGIVGKGSTASLVMNNVTMSYIESYGSGGSLSSSNLQKIYMDRMNCTNSRSRSSGNGGFGNIIGISGQSTLFVNDSFFSNISSIGSGGVFFLDSMRNITITRSHFQNSISSGSGILYAGTISGSFIMDDCNFLSIRSSSSGGVFFGSSVAIVQIISSQFYNCSSAGQGGAIYLNSVQTQLVFNRICFHECFASSNYQISYIVMGSSSIGDFDMITLANNGKGSYNYGFHAQTGNIFVKNINSTQNIQSYMLSLYPSKMFSLTYANIFNHSGIIDYIIIVQLSGDHGTTNYLNFVGNRYSSYGVHYASSSYTHTFTFCVFQNNTGGGSLLQFSGVNRMQSCYISDKDYWTQGALTTVQCTKTTIELTQTQLISHYSTYYCPGIGIEQNEVPCQTMPSNVDVIQFPSPTGCICTHEEQNIGITAIFHIIQLSMLSLALMS